MTTNNRYNNKKLLSVTDLCEYLGMGKTTIRKMLSEQNCPYVCRINGRVFANKTILDKYIDQNTGR